MSIGIFILVNLITSNFLVDLLPPNVFRFILSMWSPAIFAIIFSIVGGLPIKSTLGLTKSRWAAYFVSLGFPILIALSTVAIGIGLGYLTPSASWTIQISNAIPTLIIWVIASLGEELGWRGFLHTGMKRFPHAPLWIGLVWALWHFSQVIAESGMLHALAVFTPTVILLSYFLSSLREYGGGIWPGALFHGVWNFLRLKILFGDPAQDSIGLFTSNVPQLTDMEGVFGLISLLLFSIPIILYWYKKISPALKNKEQEITH